MPFQNFGGNKNKYCNLSDINFFMIGTRIRIYFRPGSGSTFSKCGYEDPDPLFEIVGKPKPEINNLHKVIERNILSSALLAKIYFFRNLITDFFFSGSPVACAYCSQ